MKRETELDADCTKNIVLISSDPNKGRGEARCVTWNEVPTKYNGVEMEQEYTLINSDKLTH